jgi:hypothetical protein
VSNAATIRERGNVRGSVAEYLARNPAILCLAVLAAVSGAVLISMGSHLVLYGDEWNMVFERRGFSAGVFLDPHNGHLTAGVIAIYKLLLETFGMSSPLPFHVTSTLVYLLAAVLLFAYARRRVGDWLALLGTTVILFFGAAAADMLSPFQVFFSGSIAAGLGVLLALDRDDRRGDAIACGLLVISTSFSEVGLAFTLGALVRLTLSPRPWASRVYVPGVSLVLFGLWWLGWGHTAESSLTWHNVGRAPLYVLDAASTAVGALLGLVSAGDQLPDPVGQAWAPILLVAALTLAAGRVGRVGRVPRGVWPVLAIGLTFWVLAALNGGAVRPADSDRYVYPSGVFILLIGAELLSGVRLRSQTLLVGAAVAGMAVAANLAFLSDTYKLFWKPGSTRSQADLRALEIVGPVNPSFMIGIEEGPFFYDMNAGALLSAVDAWGSPAYTDAELAARPEADRLAVDRILGNGLALGLEPGVSTRGPCQVVTASREGSTGMRLAPGTIALRSKAPSLQVKLGRFSDGLPVDIGSLREGELAFLEIPSDGSGHPWQLGIAGHGRVVACGREIVAT